MLKRNRLLGPELKLTMFMFFGFRLHFTARDTADMLKNALAIVSVPSTTPPAERSRSRDIRSKTLLLEASLITGAMALPMVVPRPVVKTTAVAPAATSPGVDS